jgi:hypothetical protein
MTQQPNPICVCCESNEVSVYELVCSTCRPFFVEAGVIDEQPDQHPQPDNRIQIGPLDV